MVVTLALLLTVGCHKNQAPKAAGDEVDQKLQDLAGSKAKNCGRVPAGGDVKPASDCAMQENQAKHPFYVAYEMPGLTMALAGAPDGKLYAVQSEAKEGAEAAGPKQATVTPCPSELRLAQSGRVTCYAAGTFMGSGAGAHGGGVAMPPGGMGMPPAGMNMPSMGGGNPHGGGMMMPPPGTANPHGSAPTTGTASSHKQSASNN